MWKSIDEKIISIKSFCLSSKITKGKILGQKNQIKTFGYIEIESESGKKGFSENYASVYITDLTNPIVDYLQKYIKIYSKQISKLPHIEKCVCANLSRKHRLWKRWCHQHLVLFNVTFCDQTKMRRIFFWIIFL